MYSKKGRHRQNINTFKNGFIYSLLIIVNTVMYLYGQQIK